MYISVKINVFVYICLYTYIYYIYIYNPATRHTWREQADRHVNIPPNPKLLKKAKKKGFVTSCLGTAVRINIAIENAIYSWFTC